MPATFLVAADPADTSIAFDFPKAMTPYVRVIYDELKREGETLDQWVCRFVCEKGVHVAMTTKLAGLKDTADTLEVTDRQALQAEATAILP